MQKNVARARRAARIDNTRGVTSGSGPSSSVIATSPRAAAAAGSRVQLAPSALLRGHSPRPVSSA
jgi:hypothetical protein